LQIPFLKIYDLNRKAVFATEIDETGKIESKPELRDALELETASVLVERDAEGGAFYELYLPYHSEGHIVAVFELYEPIAGFDSLVWKVIRPVIVIPVPLFAILMAALTWLVGRAQDDISLRTELIMSLRQRLERLVSHRAVTAMRADEGKQFRAETLEAALFYADLRGFTSFAEHHSPLEVIDFLNRIIGLQVEIIESHGGDIDKMIGDAVLARFQGPGRAAHAINAAIDIQNAIKSSGLARGVAIGIFDGLVVAGLIGAAGRYDYTIVGDSVNIAARLCGLAKEGEIIADNAAITMSTTAGFGPVEAVSVKGCTGALIVRRLQPSHTASAL
jgi:adenylate cyclase